MKLVLARALVTTKAPASITTKGLQNPAKVSSGPSTPVTPRTMHQVMVIRPKGHLFNINAMIIQTITAITRYASMIQSPVSCYRLKSQFAFGSAGTVDGKPFQNLDNFRVPEIPVVIARAGGEDVLHPQLVQVLVELAIVLIEKVLGAAA